LIKRVVIVLCSLCVLLALSAQPGVAAEQPRRPYGIAVEQWSRNFDAVAREIERGEITQGRAAELKKDLGAIGAEAKRIKADAQRELGPLQDQLQALGPAPAEGEPAETGEIATQRKKLQDDIADYQARIKQADLTLARIQDLTLQINEQTLERSIALLTTAYPIPVAPKTVTTAVPELFVVLARLGKAPVEWWQSLTDAVHISVLTRIAIFLIPALILAWLIRRALVRYFGRDPAIHVVILSAEGAVFSAGHDLKEITAARAAPDKGRAFFEETMAACSAMMQAVVRCPKPVIAAVQGTAVDPGNGIRRQRPDEADTEACQQ